MHARESKLFMSLVLGMVLSSPLVGTSHVDATTVTAYGTDPEVTFVKKKNAVFIGSDLGYSDTGYVNNIVAIGYGKNISGPKEVAGDTVIVGNTSGANARGATMVGQNTAATGENSTIIGSNASTASYSTSTTGATAIGSYAKVNASQGTALGYFTEVSYANEGSVALGARSKATVKAGERGYLAEDEDTTGKNKDTWVSKLGAVSVGSSSWGNRQITNLSAGTQDTDAVNVAQLKRVHDYAESIAITQASDVERIDGSIQTLTTSIEQIDGKVQEIDSSVDQMGTAIQQLDGQVQQIGSSVGNINSSLERLDNSTHQLDRRTNRVGAMSAALAGLHPLQGDGKFNFAVAGGFYRNEKAMALGAFYTPNDVVSYSIGSTIGSDDNMYNVGASFKVVPSSKRPASQDTKQVQSLQREVSELKAQRQQDEARIAQLETLVNQLVGS